MLSRLLVVQVLYLVFGVLFAVARSLTSQVIVCVPGQCLQGFSNVTLGQTLSAQGDTSVQLLPGQYTFTTPPQLLHIVLTSASASLSPSPGFNSSSVKALPLNIDLQPGIAMYPNQFYSGQPAFSNLPSVPVNNSIPLPASSIALSNNIWVALTSGSGSSRIIFWDSFPDVSQLPSSISLPLALVDIQSSACSPPCAGSTVCNASEICECPRGFAGSACESCADGFFGPTCQPCPSQCEKCDQGTSGSGRCIVPILGNAPATCNCLNGICGAGPNATCTCNPGWTKASNGTACAQCAPGFYLTSSGDCQICHFGCTRCADNTGDCLACKNDLFSKNQIDSTKCDPLPAKIKTTGTLCPDGSYSAGNKCDLCSTTCTTCYGPSSKNCTICRSGLSQFRGKCVAVDADGVCVGTGGMIVDNNKQECDACGAKCTSCKYPNFNSATIASQRVCTACLPGYVLSNGTCLDNCPSGTFASKDNLTCSECSSPCGTCLGSADFCLSCTNQQLASSGQCVSVCPAGSFSASGACVKCHPDCQSCTGESFDQCASCPSSRPILTSGGRCLPTCSKSEYFDLTTSTCQDCDSSCSSCCGSGSANCLACSSSDQVLRAGSCVPAECTGPTSVIPNFGVCLSDLVQQQNSTNTAPATTPSTIPSIPSIPSISSIPSIPSSSSVPKPSSSPTAPIVLDSSHLLWWQILLMVLGGIFFIILILVLWRKLARTRRAEETVMFASARQIDGTDGWGWRLKQVKDILLGRKKGGYDIDDYPPSYGYGESSHRGSFGQNLDIDLSNPMAHYLDDGLSTYSLPRSMRHRPSTRSKQSTKQRLDGRPSARGYRSNDPSPRREYHSDIRSPIGRHRSDNRSPTRGYQSDDPSPAKMYYLSDDPYPPEKPSSTRKPRSINRSPTRRDRSDDPSPARLHYLSDDTYPLEKRSSTKKNRSDDPSPARLYYLSDDPYTSEKPSSTRKYHSNNRSPTKEYRSDDREHPSYVRSPTKEYPPDIRSPTREYPSFVRSPTKEYARDIRSPTREYPSFARSPTREYPPDVRFPASPPVKDRWEDRLDNSLSRYPRKEGKPTPSSHFMSPPPSYPANSDRGHSSKY